jgi:hypothetical protein
VEHVYILVGDKVEYLSVTKSTIFVVSSCCTIIHSTDTKAIGSGDDDTR